MIEDDNNPYENDLQFIKMCIRQKCLLCKGDEVGETFICGDVTCPLVLFDSGDKLTTKDLRERKKVFAEILDNYYERF